MADISNNDIFLAITELGHNVNELTTSVGKLEGRIGKLEERVGKVETELKEMKAELKYDIRKVDKKISILSDDILETKADLSLLQKEIN